MTTPRAVRVRSKLSHRRDDEGASAPRRAWSSLRGRNGGALPVARISGRPVPALWPKSGPVHAILYGEAPGPRGADQSGIPFWGDRAGALVYRALVRAGAAEVPENAWAQWYGAYLRAARLTPALRGVALSNALAVCPTRDGHCFRAPTNAELRNPENLRRIRAELRRAAQSSSGRLRVIALGKRAAWLLAKFQEDTDTFDLIVMPHPSSQGLLAAAENHGKGAKLAALETIWERSFAALLHQFLR